MRRSTIVKATGVFTIAYTANSDVFEHPIPEQTEHMNPEMNEHLKPEHNNHIINLI